MRSGHTKRNFIYFKKKSFPDTSFYDGTRYKFLQIFFHWGAWVSGPAVILIWKGNPRGDVNDKKSATSLISQWFYH